MYNTLKKCIKLEFINLFTSCAFIIILRYSSLYKYMKFIFNTASSVNLNELSNFIKLDIPWLEIEKVQNYILNIGGKISIASDIIIIIISILVSILIFFIPMVISLLLLIFANNKNKLGPDLIISILFEIYRIIIVIECIELDILLIPMIIDINDTKFLISLVICITSVIVVYIIQSILIIKHFKDRKKNLV